MEKRTKDADKYFYKRYIPSSSTLQIVGEKLNLVFKKRFGRIKLGHQGKPL